MGDLTQPVRVAGMHRSGTSLVTNALRLCGLYLGPERDLLEIRVGNPEGHWENRRFVAVNDAVLARLGGWWAGPPATSSYERGGDLGAEKEAAARLLREFAGREWWGWKDPRNCLTLPFWQEFFPGMKTVICLRHPLEVVRSLERRGEALVRANWPRVASGAVGMKVWRTLDRAAGTLGGRRERVFFPAEHWLALWKTYNGRALEFTRPADRIVTHYDAYFTDPRAELSRVLSFLGVEHTGGTLERGCAVVSAPMRNERLDVPGGRAARLDAEASDLYARLCEESRVSP